METKQSGFWKDYGAQILNMTRTSKRQCVINALIALNREMIELYETVKKPHTTRQFDAKAGYVLHQVVLVDVIQGPHSNLSYLQQEVLDAYSKDTLLQVMKQLNGLAMDHENVQYRQSPGHEFSRFSASWQTSEMLTFNLRRILLFIMGRTNTSLRDIATMHVPIYYGREPHSE